MSYHEPRDYALVVGIDNYPRYGTKGRDLKGAIRDAKIFADWLIDTNSGGGLPRQNCKLITSDGDPMALGKDTIDDALDDIWKLVKNNGGGRRLYMFFSGHGQIVDNPDYVSYQQSLCLPRWSFTRPHAAILTDSYRMAAQNCMPFKEIAVFLDCCRVSTVRVRADNTSLGCPTFHDGHDDVKKQVFFAAEPMKQAFEGKDDVVHGHFTKALIEGLKAGSDRPEGGITAKRLWEHLEYRVQKIAEEAGHNQRPGTDPGNPYDDMIFGRAIPETVAQNGDSNFKIRFNDWRNGPVQLLNSEAVVLRAGDPSDGTWEMTLKPELHVLIDMKTQEQYSFHFRKEMEGSDVTF